MPQRHLYPNPPIVEAVMEFRFVHPISRDDLSSCIGNELASRYSGERQQQELIQVAAQVSQAGIASQTVRQPYVELLRSSDGLRLVGCGTGVLSIHVLAPYPGWESFIEQAEAAVAAVPADILAGGFLAVTIRYIDKIRLPDKFDGHLEAYLVTIPSLAASFPETLSRFHWVTQGHDASRNQTLALTVASDLPEEGRPVLLYDLAVSQRPSEGESMIPGDAWRSIVDELHVRQRDVFEESITEQMRELFE